ncbi:MAG: tRNA (N6-threonylcarbamoyladenosine(37)-N6)-methyltransferase TrmO [Clostridia bacterium]|nr:tRNA (N6-threonylcarbamoyladenosine(37)-N6)-methyltransferase TrmO [Clostridiales bacterium]MBQ2978019.1 tRNA (N6-threonylcarbamoyladenosine(37)-N6)-methyltransferase TrmO [Clostridia bacterium]
MQIIAHLHNDFPTKFGLPRQSGLAKNMLSTIVFEKEYQVPEALRGLDGYSHLWLLWEFHQAKRESWSPTVRPPRLGGNTRMGVFATRSPFRPNPIGLSCVKLEEIKKTAEHGYVLIVSGADLMDGTPIFDIKPYLPYADCHPEATGGFAQDVMGHALKVEFPEEWLEKIPEDRRETLLSILEQDPRPGYQQDPGRIYGFAYGQWEIKFRVEGEILTVCQVEGK